MNSSTGARSGQRRKPQEADRARSRRNELSAFGREEAWIIITMADRFGQCRQQKVTPREKRHLLLAGAGSDAPQAGAAPSPEVWLDPMHAHNTRWIWFEKNTSNQIAQAKLATGEARSPCNVPAKGIYKKIEKRCNNKSQGAEFA